MSKRIAPFWRDGLAFCPACCEPLGTEEISYECCDACDGTGRLNDDDGGAVLHDPEDDDWLDEPIVCDE